MEIQIVRKECGLRILNEAKLIFSYTHQFSKAQGIPNPRCIPDNLLEKETAMNSGDTSTF